MRKPERRGNSEGISRNKTEYAKWRKFTLKKFASDEKNRPKSINKREFHWIFNFIRRIRWIEFCKVPCAVILITSNRWKKTFFFIHRDRSVIVFFYSCISNANSIILTFKASSVFTRTAFGLIYSRCWKSSKAVPRQLPANNLKIVSPCRQLLTSVDPEVWRKLRNHLTGQRFNKFYAAIKASDETSWQIASKFHYPRPVELPWISNIRKRANYCANN